MATLLLLGVEGALHLHSGTGAVEAGGKEAQGLFHSNTLRTRDS